MALLSFEAAHDVGERFLDLLHKHKIDPPVGSGIEGELLSLTELLDAAKNPTLASGANQASIIRSAAGLHDLAAKVLSVEPIPEFSTFVPHLELIACAKFLPASRGEEKKLVPASIGQNVATGPFDDTARKMAELYIGCLAACVGTNVELDHPTNSIGDNPDVLFDVEETQPISRIRRWALAIKTISTTSGQTVFERIEEAAQQIDSPRCKADVGIVVINAKSALDHDLLWNPPVPFANLPEAVNALGSQLRALGEAAEKDRDPSEWERLFKNKAVRPVLFMGQSAVRLPTPAGAETATALKLLMPYEAVGTGDPVATALAELLNSHMQNILLGIPGRPDQAPC
jgi:hypothetical protein